MPTIKDIAKMAGVDKSTVSLVLSEKPSGSRISEKTRQKIYESAKKLNYVPNVLARGLRGGPTNSVGILWDLAIAQPSAEMARALAKIIRSRDYAPYVIDTCGDYDVIISSMQDLAKRGADGVVVSMNLPVENPDRFAFNLKPFSSTVIVTSEFQPIKANQIIYDRFEAIKAVARHFALTGRKKPAIVSADVIRKRKARAFAAQLHEHDIELAQENIIFLEMKLSPSGIHNWGDVCYRTLEQIYPDGNISFDALFCSADEEAMAAIKWLTARGIKVPEDVAVVGFNDYEMSKYFSPSLASISRKEFEVAKAVEELLFEGFQGNGSDPKTLRISMDFVCRESAG